jgi:hypothetical protein
MRRKILIALLAAGTVGGYATGIASLVCAKSHQHEGLEQRGARGSRGCGPSRGAGVAVK